MGLVSNDLKNIVDKLGDAKNSINAKYGVMRANNTTSPQADLEHLYINELSPSIDKIECLNTYGDVEVDPKKVLEGTMVFSQGKAIIGTMPDHGDASAVLYEGNSVLSLKDGHYDDGEVKIQFQEKTATPSNGLQIVEPDHGYVLSRVFVDGVQTQQKSVRPGKDPQDVKPDPEFFLTNVHVEGDADLLPENIKPGIEVFGVVGAMPAITVDEILDVQKTSVTIPEGYSDGTGKVKIQLQQKTVTPGTTDQTVTPDSKHVLSKVTVKGDSNLKAENIKPGVEIFGVTGSMPSNAKVFKLNKARPTDESPAGYYGEKITAEITDYDIVYVVNERGQVAAVQTVTCGEPFNLIGTEPTSNNGDTFAGWSRTATSSIADFHACQRISSDLVDRGCTCVLYAVWQANEPPSPPSIAFSYENGGKLKDDGTETAIITITPGVDPEGKMVTNTLTCNGDNANKVSLTKISDTQYKAVFSDIGIFVFIATSTDPHGLSASEADTANILGADGSFGGQGVFSVVGEDGTFTSDASSFVSGCYITKVVLNIAVGSGHSNSSDYVTAFLTKTDGTIEERRIHTGSFGSSITITKTFTLADDVRQIAFKAVTPGHDHCISESSTITWDIDYKFDMALWEQEGR